MLYESNNSYDDSKDQRNKAWIEDGRLSLSLIFGSRRGLSAKEQWLLESGTPQDRQAYVGRRLKLSFAILFCIAAVIGWAVTRPGPQKFVPTITFMDAGSIKELQLHETTFSTSTTVTTTAGVFQARGGVSGAAGDQVRIKTTTLAIGGHKKSLCVESSLIGDCYPLK